MSASARILVVKTSSLGDVVHALPAVTDIAALHPHVAIDWVCEEGFAGIPRLHRSVSRVIPCAIRRWRKSWWTSETRHEIDAFKAALAESRYDLAIDFQGLFKSAWIMRQVRTTRHGYRWNNAREPLATLLYDVRHRVEWGQHAIVRNRLLAAKAMGHADTGPVRYGVDANAFGHPESSVFTERSAAAREAFTLVALHATSRADKSWPESQWRDVLQHVSKCGASVVIPWGSDVERERSMRLGDGIERATVPERMEMAGLAQIFADASIVVGVDTGLVHLAVAAGAPTIAIFGPTDPALTGVVAERSPAVNLGGNGQAPSAEQVIAAIDSMLASMLASVPPSMPASPPIRR